MSPSGQLSAFTVRFGHFGHLRKAGEELGYEGVDPWRHLAGGGLSHTLYFPPTHSHSPCCPSLSEACGAWKQRGSSFTHRPERERSTTGTGRTTSDISRCSLTAVWFFYYYHLTLRKKNVKRHQWTDDASFTHSRKVSRAYSAHVEWIDLSVRVREHEGPPPHTHTPHTHKYTGICFKHFSPLSFVLSPTWGSSWTRSFCLNWKKHWLIIFPPPNLNFVAELAEDWAALRHEFIIRETEKLLGSRTHTRPHVVTAASLSDHVTHKSTI